MGVSQLDLPLLGAMGGGTNPAPPTAAWPAAPQPRAPASPVGRKRVLAGSPPSCWVPSILPRHHPLCPQQPPARQCRELTSIPGAHQYLGSPPVPGAHRCSLAAAHLPGEPP